MKRGIQKNLKDGNMLMRIIGTHLLEINLLICGIIFVVVKVVVDIAISVVVVVFAAAFVIADDVVVVAVDVVHAFC